MANILNMDKQIMIIGALAEGSSIRSIERMAGVHRDTIMRLGVKVGQGEPEKPFRHVTALRIHPALSPIAAVRAFIVQEFRNAPSEA